jgi:hypothetical protein
VLLHTLLHRFGTILFVLLIAVAFTYAMAIRPGAEQPIKKTTALACAVVGIVIGLLFLSTYSLYIQSTGT